MDSAIRVLLVDDEELVRFGLRTVLEAAGDFEVVGEAGDGAAAVRSAHELRPDVVLMDIRMPVKDGLAATREILALPQPPQVAVLTTFHADEYVYSAAEILDVCRRARVPMVFDAHHHVCRERLASYEDQSVAHFLAAARETWPDPAWQLTHISNGRTAFNDRHHSDLITEMPTAYRAAPWIEVEAKHKELAIERLTAEWLSA